MSTDHQFQAIFKETSVSKLWWKVSSDYLSLGQSAVKALLHFGSAYLEGGGGFISHGTDSDETEKLRYMMTFPTWPIAPAPRCSTFLIVFGNVVITAPLSPPPFPTVKPPRHTAHDATWVERWAGSFRSSRKKKYSILAAGTRLFPRHQYYAVLNGQADVISTSSGFLPTQKDDNFNPYVTNVIDIYIYIYIYIYGAPILDVSRSHTTTQHSR